MHDMDIETVDERRSRSMNDYLECIVKFQYGMEVGYREELVRCKDCVNCIKEPNGVLYCDVLAIGYEPLGSKRVTEDWFCADGERKGETKIIRCKDCKHFVAEGQTCKYHGMYISLKPDNYCTHGERR